MADSFVSIARMNPLISEYVATFEGEALEASDRTCSQVRFQDKRSRRLVENLGDSVRRYPLVAGSNPRSRKSPSPRLRGSGLSGSPALAPSPCDPVAAAPASLIFSTSAPPFEACAWSVSIMGAVSCTSLLPLGDGVGPPPSPTSRPWPLRSPAASGRSGWCRAVLGTSARDRSLNRKRGKT